MVSGGVMAGNLLKRVAPVYPPDAKAGRIQGTVVLQVMISATGEVTSAAAISGPPPLRQSAVDSVKQWQYRPYLLNGQPVEVRSLVNVVYSLGDATAR
jgi:protein TonB